ncbi:hypothetical protein INR49_001149 [Caranx melampygus]|nr:hypothetical protein INR49_001149 [Caranx melampygus]
MNFIKRELLLLETSRFFVSPHRHTEVSPSQVSHHRDRDTSTMSDYMYEREDDGSTLWTKGPVSVSRFRRWLFPALTATVVLALIIAVGASNVKTSSRLSSAEQTVSNLTNIIQSLNASLQHAQGAGSPGSLMVGQITVWVQKVRTVLTCTAADVSTTCTAPSGCASSARDTASAPEDT